MKIVVLVKEVPDTYGDRKLSLETGLAERGASDAVLDEISERSVEVALKHADLNPGTEVVVLSMGPAGAAASLRKGLAMGAGSAVHIVDDELAGADLGTTASVLSAALQRTGFDVVIAGNQSTDGAGGVIPAMVAEHLGLPHLTALTSVEITDVEVSGTRASEAGTAQLSATLPVVISITEALPDPRFPNIKGIRGANKKPFETLSLQDLGVDAAQGTTTPRSIMTAISEKPARGPGEKIFDEGDAGTKIAEFLFQNRLA
ncbi:electron transfer flavoprotein subunit beta/FixA family protein [Paenarthrobacter ureafaciens]|uniref:electron transfer flavoprotein subunit beta/FixA family protein n=1 Tax=Paenarthrobacter ureafaciens TaxID=37931 RepID=UPI002DBDDE68|nr:electron transfer flavoprotein subunit beta/FixA family protein [Paenarthrobacter ureafaciens]MEC3853123.1 electron transfer flavoprotein subunit beta/FixA family protein [Paenarthrobacter ureafaciens]